MLLLVDLGNTRIKWAVLADSLDHFSHTGSAKNTDYLSKQALPLEIGRVVVSSVASRNLLESHLDNIFHHWGCVAEVIEVSEGFNDLKNRYKDIPALGVDRWVAAVGAHNLYAGDDIVIIDAGTAITIDVVNSKSEFLGGVIMPGMQLMHDALIGNTAQIRAQTDENPPLIGRSTQECVSSGVRLGVSGGVDRVVSAFKQELSANIGGDSSLKTLICGGDAQWLMSASCLDFEYAPDLIFNGLTALTCKNIKSN